MYVCMYFRQDEKELIGEFTMYVGRKNLRLVRLLFVRKLTVF